MSGHIPDMSRVDPDAPPITNDAGADPRADRALLAAAVAGAGEAFGVLYRRHVRAVYAHCFRRLGTAAAAEDATSLVFLEAWRRRADIPDLEQPALDGSALPWLLGVATNVTRNQSRSMRRHRAALDRLPPALHEPDPSESVAARLDAERAMQSAVSEIRRLPVVEQEVVALVVWAELTYAQAAIALGLPVATVRSRLARARAHLRATRPAPSDALTTEGDSR